MVRPSASKIGSIGDLPDGQTQKMGLKKIGGAFLVSRITCRYIFSGFCCSKCVSQLSQKDLRSG